jgi:hypothetical protein
MQPLLRLDVRSEVKAGRDQVILPEAELGVVADSHLTFCLLFPTSFWQ